MAEKKSFLVYFDQRCLMKKMTDEQIGMLFRLVMDYAENGTVPDIEDPRVDVAFESISTTIDRDSNKYLKRCEKNRENVKKRWDTNANDRIQSNTKHTDRGSDRGRDSDITSDNSNEVADPLFKHKPKTCEDETWTEYLDFSRSFMEKQKGQWGKLVKITNSTLSASSKALDNLIRVQGYNKPSVYATIEWAATNNFWSKNVISLGGLTKKSNSNGMLKFDNVAAARQDEVTRSM